MKKYIIANLLLLFFIPGFSQNSRFEYRGRYTPSIKKDKLGEAKFITEIMPEFTRYFSLPSHEKTLFDEQLKLSSSLNGNYIYPQEFYDHPLEKYNNVIYFVSIEISGICHGKKILSQSTNEILSAEQKEILKTADPGSDISINIKFRYKVFSDIGPDKLSGIKDGNYTVTVVPENEAEYLGGYKQMSEYINKNIFDKISEKNAAKKIQQATVKFTISDTGQIINAKMFKSSSDTKTDKQIIDAINKMPKWKPAKNSNGINVQQEFTIPFGGGGC